MAEFEYFDCENDYKSVADGVKAMGGPDGWWKRSTGDTLVELGNELVARGFSVKGALLFLDRARGAVSGEFGC